jgi:DNA-binding transcriptional regulator/RsmH inhibitor MraZ
MRDLCLDVKGRFTLPAQYRDAFGGNAVRLVAPPDRTGIWIFSVAEFIQLRSHAIMKLSSPDTSTAALELVTLLLNRTTEVAIDSYDRITIPRPYLNQSGLTAPGTNTLVGSGNFLEIKPIRPLKPAAD